MIREAKVVTCCPENRLCLLDGKNRKKSPVHLYDLKFLHSMRYTIVKLSYVLIFLFELHKCPKKFSTTRCSVFHRFCHVLPLLTFANLKLAFYLQKTFWKS